jgi:glycosyltransferase involved in cell wall biosynthesis
MITDRWSCAVTGVRNKIAALVFKSLTKCVIGDYNEFLPEQSVDLPTGSEKKALLSYLVPPLIPPPGKRNTSTFSNAGIAQYIPRALNELGYSVDIINYDNNKFVPDKKFDLFIGHGGINFEKIEKTLDPACTRIYFSTGTYWKEWNRVEKERLDMLQKRRGVILPADRSIEHGEEYANVNSDGIICLGNDHAKKTYGKFPCVLNINNAVYPDAYSLKNKNFEVARNNFLFFNGGGNVHKGLDIMLEAFSQLEHHLYVRQDIEPAFLKVYKKELTEYPNIHLVPYLKKPSKEFFSLMDSCDFVISPTCAEGQPGSVIECMAHGLIPILSREANIDTKEFGITLKENSVEEITSVVSDVSGKPDAWYKQKSFLTLEEIQNYYTPEQFLKNMKNAVQTIIRNRRPPEN